MGAEQLLCHLVGDYVIQSDWMAQQKTKSHFPAIVHAIVYTLPFLLLTQSWAALAVMASTHFVIDRWRLARYVVWAKNFMAPKSGWPKPWADCKGTGYNPEVPAWMAVWLMIIVDNVMHITINALAINWL